MTQLAFIEEINTLNQVGVFRVSTLESAIVSARRPQIDKGREDVGSRDQILFIQASVKLSDFTLHSVKTIFLVTNIIHVSIQPKQTYLDKKIFQSKQ